MADPSIPGFIKYIARGKKLESEVADEEAKARAAEEAKKKERKPSPVFERARYIDEAVGKKKGGKVKKYARGGGIEVRGKTRGRFV